MRNGAVPIEVHVESLGLEVLCDHHAGLDDTGLLGEVPLREGLELSVFIAQVAACYMLTVSLFWSSESFLPTSLLVHSSVLSPELEVIPGTTRGMLTVDVWFVC